MTIPDTLHALAAEVALKHAREPYGDEPALRPTRRDEALETSAEAAESLGLGFHLGAAVERIALAAGEGSDGEPRLREATWLIERYVTLLEDPQLAHTGEEIPAEVAELATPPSPEPEPVQVVQELPSVRRELLVTAVRAVIWVAAIVVVVLALTLIAQLR